MKPEAQILYDETAGTIQISGYAYTFDEDEIHGGPDAGGWIERITRDALHKPRNVRLRVNFDGRPIAQTKDGTLDLSLDNVGLWVVATPKSCVWTWTSLRTKVNSHINIGMSFIVKEQHWSAAPGFKDNPITYRLITKLDLVDLVIRPREADHQ